MRYNDFKISDPVEELARKLPTLKRIDYDAIDALMQRVSYKHKLSGQKLHDLFVSKYGHTPDTWVKRIKQRNEEVNEATQPEYILFIDGKPASKYVDSHKAQLDLKHLQQKFPNKHIEVKQEVCKMQPIMKEGDVVPFKKPSKPVKPQYGTRTFPGKQRNVQEPEGNVTPIKKKNTVTGSTLHSIYEEEDPTIKEINKFIEWTKKRLNITSNPEFTFSKDTEAAQEGHHTGVHSGNKIWIYIGNRNLVDILRTVFHELVHQRQDELNMIQPGDSYPGSPIEAMADMLAGKYMKVYGKEHPEIFQ